jgi:two-component system torCAD operon response regulator TorR
MTNTAFHIVIVEDDAVTRAKLAAYFALEGYRVSEAESAEQLRSLVQRDPAHLLLIDIMLPGEDGLSLTREVRSQSDVGIILVTGRTDEIDRVLGLEFGADDYVTKPFSQRELLARAKNLLRRGAQASFGGGLERRFEGFVYDLGKRRLFAPDRRPVELTHAEQQLLALFVRSPGQTLPREQILRQVAHRNWTPFDRTADVLVNRLRRKLGDNTRDPRFIRTAHGEGYIFVAPVT